MDARLGVIKLRLDREAPLVGAPTPVIAGDGQQVRVAKVRNEGPQQTILEDSKRLKKVRGRTREPLPLKYGHKTLSSRPLTRGRDYHIAAPRLEVAPLAKRDRQAGWKE